MNKLRWYNTAADFIDVFLTSFCVHFLPNREIFYRTVCYHIRNKQIGLLLHGRPISSSLVWLQTELDSTQSYYYYLLCTQRIKSDLPSAREIWTALILWKINLWTANSWFDSPSSEKVKVSPSNFLAAIFSSQMFFSLSARKIMIGQSREGLFVVYDCMANASLPWLNVCSHRQYLA